MKFGLAPFRSVVRDWRQSRLSHLSRPGRPGVELMGQKSIVSLMLPTTALVDWRLIRKRYVISISKWESDLLFVQHNYLGLNRGCSRNNLLTKEKFNLPLFRTSRFLSKDFRSKTRCRERKSWEHIHLLWNYNTLRTLKCQLTFSPIIVSFKVFSLHKALLSRQFGDTFTSRN